MNQQQQEGQSPARRRDRSRSRERPVKKSTRGKSTKKAKGKPANTTLSTGPNHGASPLANDYRECALADTANAPTAMDTGKSLEADRIREAEEGAPWTARKILFTDENVHAHATLFGLSMIEQADALQLGFPLLNQIAGLIVEDKYDSASIPEVCANLRSVDQEARHVAVENLYDRFIINGDDNDDGSIVRALGICLCDCGAIQALLAMLRNNSSSNELIYDAASVLEFMVLAPTSKIIDAFMDADGLTIARDVVESCACLDTKAIVLRLVGWVAKFSANTQRCVRNDDWHELVAAVLTAPPTELELDAVAILLYGLSCDIAPLQPLSSLSIARACVDRAMQILENGASNTTQELALRTLVHIAHISEVNSMVNKPSIARIVTSLIPTSVGMYALHLCETVMLHSGEDWKIWCTGDFTKSLVNLVDEVGKVAASPAIEGAIRTLCRVMVAAHTSCSPRLVSTIDHVIFGSTTLANRVIAKLSAKDQSKRELALAFVYNMCLLKKGLPAQKLLFAGETVVPTLCALMTDGSIENVYEVVTILACMKSQEISSRKWHREQARSLLNNSADSDEEADPPCSVNNEKGVVWTKLAECKGLFRLQNILRGNWVGSHNDEIRSLLVPSHLD